MTVKASFLKLRRSIASKDIANSSLYIPLYHQILGKIEGSELVAREDDISGTVFEFHKGDAVHRARVHPETLDIIQYSRLEKGRFVERLVFSNILWDQDLDLQL